MHATRVLTLSLATMMGWASLAGGALAQGGGTSKASPLPAPLVQAVRRAVHDNPEVQAKWNALQAAGAEGEVTAAARRPQMEITANGGLENNVTPLVDYGSYGTASSRLVFRQMLYDGGFNASELRRLGFTRLMRLYELREVSEVIALEAFRAYADVLRYRDLVEAATDNYVEHKQVYAQVEERANAGVGRRVDVEQAAGRLALAESNLLTELTNLHDISVRYQRVVGDKPPARLPRLSLNFRLPAQPGSIQQLFEDGLTRNAAINAALENVRALNQAVASRQLAGRPRVELRAYQNLGHNSSGTPGNTRTHGVEAVLNFSILDGGAREAGTRQSVFERDQARDLQEKVCRDTRQALAIAFSDTRAKQEQLKYRDEHRLTTEKSREAYRQQFDIGQRSLLDLLDSQNEFFEATRAWINTRYEQIGAQARTLAAMGSLVDTLGVARPDLPTPQALGQTRIGIEPGELCPMDTTVVDTIERIKSEVVVPPRRSPSLIAAGKVPAAGDMPGWAAGPGESGGTRTANGVAGIAGAATAPVTPRPTETPGMTINLAPLPGPAKLPASPWAQSVPETKRAQANKDDLLDDIAKLTEAVDTPEVPRMSPGAAVPTTGNPLASRWGDPPVVPVPAVPPELAAPAAGPLAQMRGDRESRRTVPPPTQQAHALAPSDAKATQQQPAEASPIDAAHAAVWDAVQQWAQAWSSRDMAAYVSAYSPNFKGSHASRENWIRQRTARITQRGAIRVDVREPTITIEGQEARVHFTQSYQSGGLREIEPRFLKLSRTEDRWLITIESGR